MRRVRRLSLAALLVAASALPATPQDDSPGFIARQIENALSGPGREVRVRGFQGALSGRATLDEMTFADADGVWLTLSGAVLDWNRAALLRGRLTVNELSAEDLIVARTPLPAPGTGPAPEAPAAEASGFALPDLPVSVNVQGIAIGEVLLGAPILGEEATFRVDGGLVLDGGEGDVDIQLVRTNEVLDRIVLAASFDNESRVLALDLTVEEGAGGLASNLIGIPGAPSLALDIDGTGPLDDYTAVIDLRTDDVQRVAGDVTLRGTDEDGLRFAANVGGDITPLVAPDYSDFFGDDIRLVVDGTRSAEGALDLAELAITARSLSMRGTAALGDDLRPIRFSLNGALADPDGTRVQPPLQAGEEGPLSLDRADISLQFDRAVADAWTLSVSALEIEAPQGQIDALTFGGGGVIDLESEPIRVTAALDYGAQGVAPTDARIAEALGPVIEGRARVDWRQGEPLVLQGLTLGGATYGLDLSGNAVFAERTLRLDGQAQVLAEDLSRFAAITGQALTGRAEIALAGEGDVLGGTFQGMVDVTGEGLGIGQEVADRFLEGPVALTASARRDTTGTFLDGFELTSTGVTAVAEGRVGSGVSDLSGEVTLLDLGLVRPDLDGAVTLTGEAGESRPGLWDVDVALDGAYGLVGAVAGAVGLGESDVRLDLALPDIAPFVPDYTGPIEVRGTAAEADEGVWDVDLDIGTPYEGTLALAGLLGGGQSDLALDLALPDIQPLVPQYTGAIRVQGTAAEAGGGIWDVDLDAETPYDGTLALAGAVGAGQSDVTLDLALPDIQPLVPQYTGAIRVQGNAAEAGGGAWDVDLDADAPYNTTLAVQGVVGGAQGDVRLAAQVPDVAAFAPGVPGAVALDGTAIELPDGLWQVNLDARLPYSATANVQGRAGAAGSALSYAARVPNVGAIVPQLTGALGATGTARQTPENRWQVTADVDGPYAATIDASALVGPGLDGTGRTSADVTVAVPDISPLAPTLRGGLNATASAAQEESGAWAVDLDATGPYATTAEAQGTVGGGDTNANVRVSLPDISPFAPQYAGAVTVTATAAQLAGQPIDIQANVAAPYNITADVSGQVGQGASEVLFNAAIPSISPFVAQFTGGVTLTGSALESANGWAIDVASNGPGAASLAVGGTVAADASTADLAITGGAPLGVLNGVLAPARIDGDLAIDLALNGPPGLPALGGTLSTSGTAFEVPTADLAMEGIDVTIALADGAATITGAANSTAGGGLTVEGPIGLTPPLAADLSVSLNDLILQSGALYRIPLSGGVTVTGPLTGGGQIGGRITLGETELRIPSGGVGFGGAIPQITHIAEPGAVRLTRDRAGLINTAREARDGAPGANVFLLDLRIDAPRRIFLRGRGLDTELGGSFQIGGTTGSPAPVGAIEVIRGRLDLLGKRLDLEQDGRVTLGGDLVPFLELQATSETDDFTILISIDGPVDDPQFAFSSVPQLPEDEVLAQFFFGKGLANLSPVQAVQLAASVATLTGRGPGLSSGIREGLGVDDFNVVTDDQGNAALQIGQYLTDNIYTDVTTSTAGTSEVSINIDVTDDVTVTGSADNEGETTLGIFYQRDY